MKSMMIDCPLAKIMCSSIRLQLTSVYRNVHTQTECTYGRNAFQHIIWETKCIIRIRTDERNGANKKKRDRDKKAMKRSGKEEDEKKNEFENVKRTEISVETAMKQQRQ